MSGLWAQSYFLLQAFSCSRDCRIRRLQFGDLFFVFAGRFLGMISSQCHTVPDCPKHYHRGCPLKESCITYQGLSTLCLSDLVDHFRPYTSIPKKLGQAAQRRTLNLKACT